MTTATNPETGEKFRLEDNKWVPDRTAATTLNKALPGGVPRTLDESMEALVGAGKSVAKTVADVGLSMAQGATFGFADEISAGLKTALGEGSFKENLLSTRARFEDIPTAAQVGGEIAGGLATIALTGPVLAATKVGQLFTRLPRWLQTTGLGALWGGLFGAGTAEGDIEERLESGAKGTGLGAITGGVLHGAFVGGRAAAKGVAGLARSRTNPSEQAARILGEKFATDGKTVGQVLARLRDLGPQATIADAAGVNTLGLARGVAGVPGAAKEKITQTLKVRGLGESDRITKQVTRDLGPADYFATEEAFLGKLRAGAREAYEQAYSANPSIQSAALDRVLTAPIAQSVLKEAATIAGIERASGKVKWLGPVDEELTQLARFAAEHAGGAPVVAPGVAKGLSLETWDYVKRGLDSVLDKPANTNALTGKFTKKGSAINNLKRALVEALDIVTGGEKSLYRFARKQYAGDAEVLNALREGEKFMKLRPEQITRRLAELSDGAQEAFRNGAARAVLDVVEKTPDTGSVARRLFASKMNRERIRAVFPDKAKYTEFSRRMVAEQRFTETQQAIGSGSRTTPMAQEVKDVERLAGHVGALVGSASGVGHPLIAATIGRQRAVKAASKIRGEEMDKILASWLVTRNRADQLRILDKLRPHAVPQIGPPRGLRTATLGAVQAEGRAINER
jgi:hypothetical protein